MTQVLALTEDQQEKFRLLKESEINGDLALVSMTRRDGSPAAVICDVQNKEGSWHFLPIAELIEGDPWDLYLEPTED